MSGGRPASRAPGRGRVSTCWRRRRVVVGDLVDTPSEVAGLPFTVTLAERGPWGDRVGRAAALLAELPTELGPHGWKLADRPEP